MSSGPLPPVPDLIPIAALLKPSASSHSNNNSGARRECAPCASRSEVMGEQRSRRPGKQPAVDLIDSAQSRGPSAAPQAPQSRKARSERHRKSDRRREHRKPARTRSGSKNSSKSREPSTPASSPERPANPRVNPIFVWVRQEDTRIVDVKCEDYDKRNRILLTKTAQGWRAIPRTETLVPSIKEDSQQQQQQHHHHHHHRNRKSRKSKVRRKSTAVQVDSDFQDIYQDFARNATSSPSWNCPVNVESHLPSHKIHVPKKCPSPPSVITDSPSVNSNVNESAQTQEEKCSVAKICDVSPLDNLLAVAEFEFNQHMQSGEWDKSCSHHQEQNNDDDDAAIKSSSPFEEIDEDQKEFINNMEQLNSLIDSCSKSEIKTPNDEYEPQGTKTEECDYNEDDDNNLAMDDILSRLEQSLRSPECSEITQALNDCSENYVENVEDEAMEDKMELKQNEFFTSDINENNYKTVPDELESLFDDERDDEQIDTKDTEADVENKTAPSASESPSPLEATDDLNQQPDPKEGVEEPLEQEIVESSTPSVQEDEPTDLSIKSKYNDSIANDYNKHCDAIIISDEPEQPTDLTLPKNAASSSSPVRSITPRPPSQNSEAIQSPQPSGIPAVPPSPDIVSPPSANNCKQNNKSTVFLDSLLTTSSQKIALNSEVTIIKQKEPLDLGKSRKSASPTVTCSEEVKNNADLEPPAKKFKTNNSNNNMTLRNLLDVEVAAAAAVAKSEAESKLAEKIPETPRLLELLKTDSEPDPLTQLRQILYDTNLNVPDPMLVPKERLSQIISHPGREIPRLLKQRPELRLPEALAFPHLLQDPDILVITLQQLETIILKQNQSLSLKELKAISNEPVVKTQHEKVVKKQQEKPVEVVKETHSLGTNKKKNSEDPVIKMLNAVAQDPTSLHQQQQQHSAKSGFNELANDIDAATAAAFNQMIWMPYFDQLQAMSFATGNAGANADVMKMLSNSLPMYPGQLPDLSRLPSAAAAVAANRFPPPSVNFPLQQPAAQMNYNALEMSMWQEAMMQANMLRPKLPFEGLNPKHSFRDYLDKFSFAAKPPPSMLSKSANSLGNNNNFFPHGPSNAGHFPNSFLNMTNSFQASKQHQQQQAMPHFNPALFNQKNLINQQQQKASSSSHPYLPKQKLEQKMNFANFYHQKVEENKHKHDHKSNSNNSSKLSCKSFANVSSYHHKQQQHQQQQHVESKEKSSSSSSSSSSNNGEFATKHHHHHTQPIDLSGSTAPTSKLKVKQHLIDPVNAAKLLKHHDDIPEVGSTTASVEEMQDAHKHLWHPLFGNQKGYHSPWNWTTVTATGE